MQVEFLESKQNPLLHVVSGAIAFVLYVLILGLIVSALLYRDIVEPIDFNIDMYLELPEAIDLPAQTEFKQEVKQEKIAPPVEKPIEKQEPIQTKEEVPQDLPKQEVIPIPKEEAPIPTPADPAPKEAPVEKPDLRDIFSGVSSQTAGERRLIEEEERRVALEKAQQEELERLEKERQEQNKLLSMDAEKIKQSAAALQKTATGFRQTVTQVANMKFEIDKPSLGAPVSQKEEEDYDGWYNQIQSIFAEAWQQNRFYYDTATGATVRIKVSATGKLTYLYMTKQSPFSEYNEAVEAFLHTMEKKNLPPPPKGLEFNISVNSMPAY